MIDVRASSIIYQSQIYYRDLLNDLVVRRRLGKALVDQWSKADLILGYLEALNYRTLLTNEQDILNVNNILECLIKLCELNQYPVTAPLTFQAAPAVIVGQPGADGVIGPVGPRGFTGLATDFSISSISVSTVVDSFPITDAKAARWDYVATATNGAQRASSIIGHWKSDGSSFDLADIGADDVTGSTSSLDFDLVFGAGNIQLIATISSLTWNIVGTRYFIPNNGNGTGPVSAVLPNNQVYIGNTSNVATPQSVTGDISITNTGVTSINAGVILDADINSSANITLTKLASLNNNIVPITNGSGKLISSTLNPTTLGFVDISSSLTSLLNAKLTDPMTSPGDIIIRNGSNITTRLPIGANGQVLTLTGGVPTWQNASGGAGLSGLATNYLTKATSSTTISNSTVSEIGGAVVVPGTLEAQNGIRTQANGSYIKYKLLEVPWNMNTGVDRISIAHGLDANKILDYGGFIYDNTRNLKNKIGTRKNFYSTSSTDTTEINFLDYDGSVQGLSTSYILVLRRPGSAYDNSGYNNALIKLIIWYEV